MKDRFSHLDESVKEKKTLGKKQEYKSRILEKNNNFLETYRNLAEGYGL